MLLSSVRDGLTATKSGRVPVIIFIKAENMLGSLAYRRGYVNLFGSLAAFSSFFLIKTKKYRSLIHENGKSAKERFNENNA